MKNSQVLEVDARPDTDAAAPDHALLKEALQFSPDSLRAPGIEVAQLGDKLPSLELVDSKSFSLEAEKLERNAKRSLSPERFREFKQDMGAFEQRMAQNPEEIKATYEQLNRLLEPKAESVVPRKDLPLIAAEVLSQSADSRSINQGAANTCAFAALESRIYNRTPSKAAELVANAAIDGRYKNLELDSESLKTYPRKARENPSDSTRSQASQIFQFTAVQAFHANDPAKFDGLSYKIRPTPSGGISEFLEDAKTGQKYEAPGLTVADAEKLEKLSRDITGASDAPFVVDVTRARTPEEFEATLAKIKADQNYPALLIVDATNPPFNSAGIGTRYHVVAIEAGDSPDNLMLNDQYGASRDKMVDKQTLYDAMHIPRALDAKGELFEPVVDSLIELESKLESGEAKMTELTDSLFKYAIHEYTETQMKNLEEIYHRKTGKHLQDFLAKYLSDDDMKARGYDFVPIIGWKRF